MSTPADIAAKVLRSGGVIAYPTEGVFGLGCLPGDDAAVKRILNIKKRDASKGLILIAANASQLDPWITLPDNTLLPKPVENYPITWIVPISSKTTNLIRGNNSGIAVRLTDNSIVQSICSTVESAIVATSANISGQSVAKDQSDLSRQFKDLVDYIVPGECGPASGPSEIRILATGEILRRGKK
jgi:L-threonylcarbamoyladenylate synthase